MELEKERMECPYDRNHLVDPLRMPYHLMKCRKRFPGIRLAVCPYSALHEVPPVELQYHMANCPDKRLVEGVDPPHALLHALTGREANMLKGCTDIPPPAKVHFDDDEGELWDANIERNQEPVLPSSRVPQRRCHVRRNDDADSLSLSRNSIRRPITHSLAERVQSKQGYSFESLRNVSESEINSEVEDSGRGNEYMTGKKLFSLEDRFSHNCSDLSSSSESDSTATTRSASTLARCMNFESHKCEERIKPATPLDRYFMQGRGRAKLSDILPSGQEMRPGSGLSLSSFPVTGRGRSLFKLPASET